MQSVILQFSMAFALSAITIAVLIPVSKYYSWLDVPDSERKQHAVATPPIGGFGVFVGILLTMLYINGFNQQILGYAIGGLLLVVVGAIDDKYDVNWKIRIVAQITAAICMIMISGVHAHHVGPLFGFGDIELGVISIPFSIFITLGLINAFNMLDGVDGLIGSVCFVVVCMFVAATLYAEAPEIAINLLVVLGAIAGFLLFNYRFTRNQKAGVFLGDAGSGFLGFTLAFITLGYTQSNEHPISPILGPFIMAPPIIDCLVLILHRLRNGKSPFMASRDHGHHLMLDAGFRVDELVRYMVLLTCCTGLFGAVLMYINMPAPIMVMMYLLALFFWFWITESRERAINFFQILHKKIYTK